MVLTDTVIQAGPCPICRPENKLGIDLAQWGAPWPTCRRGLECLRPSSSPDLFLFLFLVRMPERSERPGQRAEDCRSSD